ncbi:MAG: zf-HC2 domain-containing protein, partial [Actinomycetota bacterium]|nr:zf-HC2 domain-containing protein [Actinomycetota bacterium]
MTDIDHELCSERLPAYIAGELPSDAELEVARHLDGCASCRQEEVGLRALTTATEDRLAAAESTRLRAAVMSAITPTPREVPSLYSQRPSRAAFVEPRRSWRTAFAGVGAAAAVVLLAVLLFNV